MCRHLIILLFFIQTVSARSTNWRCSIRRKNLWCKASVNQHGNQVVVGPNPHIHPNDPGLTKKTQIWADISYHKLMIII